MPVRTEQHHPVTEYRSSGERPFACLSSRIPESRTPLLLSFCINSLKPPTHHSFCCLLPAPARSSPACGRHRANGSPAGTTSISQTSARESRLRATQLPPRPHTWMRSTIKICPHRRRVHELQEADVQTQLWRAVLMRTATSQLGARTFLTTTTTRTLTIDTPTSLRPSLFSKQHHHSYRRNFPSLPPQIYTQSHRMGTAEG